MPYLSIKTNRELDEATCSQLPRHASAAVAQALGKPESYVMVSLEGGANLLFAGDDAPCAYLELKSIGLPAERTAELSSALAALMESELGIDPARLYIEFADAQRHMWGWKGGTF